MKNLLSIGEVAKIRNINVQSLRYYEKLGILIPAYINPNSGYRYYSLEQLMILDTIILCIELGIPLKDLKHYVDKDGQLEFERLLKDGERLAKEKMRRISSNLNSIERTLQHINEQRAFQGKKGYYTRKIFERYCITTPCDRVMDAKTYEKKLSRLFELARQEQIQASFPHGIIATYCQGKYQGSRMFLEVLPSASVLPKILCAGEYLCFQESRDIHSDPQTIFPQKLLDRDKTDVIISSMSPNTYKYDKVTLEFQVQI